MSPSATIKSDSTLFSIIETLLELDGGGVTEIANQLDIAKSSVHKHLKSLEKHDYAVKRGDKYYLSFKFLTIGGQIRDRNRICDLSRPILYDLADKTDLIVLLSVVEYNYGIFAIIINDTYGLKKTIHVGSQFELHQNAVGKAILACMSDAEIEQLISQRGLKPSTGNTITERKKLFEEIQEIRKNNYAINLEERWHGLNAVGCGLYDETSKMYTGLSVAGPSNLLTERKLRNDLADKLLKAASKVELRLRFR